MRVGWERVNNEAKQSNLIAAFFPPPPPSPPPKQQSVCWVSVAPVSSLLLSPPG